MCRFGGFPGVWQYSTASALSKEDVILSCYNKNWVKAVSLLWAPPVERHGHQNKPQCETGKCPMVGNELPVTCLGQHLYTLAAKRPMGSGVLYLMEETTVSQTTLQGQSGDNPLSQEPHIREPVSSCGGLQCTGELCWLLSMMGILGHARWPIRIQLSLGTCFCFLPPHPHLCQIAIFLVICSVHPHKDCCFVFESLQATFNWILDFEALTVPQSTTAFVCLEEIFVDPELVKSIILPLPFSGDVLLLSCV